MISNFFFIVAAGLDYIFKATNTAWYKTTWTTNKQADQQYKHPITCSTLVANLSGLLSIAEVTPVWCWIRTKL